MRNREERSLKEFANQLYAALEPVPTRDREELEAKIGVTAGLVPKTPAALAERLNATEHRVNDALEMLKDDWEMPMVEFVDEDDGVSHWFKEAEP